MPKWMIGMILAAVPVTPALAQWSGKGEAGLAVASGNSETRSGNAKLAVSRQSGAWEHSAGFAGNHVSDDVGTTSQRFELVGQSRYQFNARDFWYGGARYEDDRFSGFNYQATVSSGVGRKFVDSDTTRLTGQIGAGYKFVETRDTIDPDTLLPVPGDTEGSAVLVGGLDFLHQLNEATSLFDKFGFEVASDNTFLQNEIGVAVKMTDRMALAVALAIRHNTDPPPGFKKTDTLTTLNLVYEVK